MGVSWGHATCRVVSYTYGDKQMWYRNGVDDDACFDSWTKGRQQRWNSAPILRCCRGAIY